MIVKRGGQTFTPSQPPAEKDGLATTDHAVYALWEAFLSMQHHRNEAIRLHERMGYVQAQIDANPGHKNVAKAVEHRTKLQMRCYEHIRQFLKWEDSAHAYWKETTQKTREEADLGAMYNVGVEVESLPALWKLPLGTAPQPAVPFPIPSVVLDFSSASSGRRYKKVG